jgi:hypothetical protein
MGIKKMKKCHYGNFIICTFRQMLLRWSYLGVLDEQVCSTLREMRNCTELQMEKLIGRHRCRWGNNIKIDLKEIEYVGVKCINLAQNRVQ